MAKKKEYQITIGYKAVVCLTVFANDEIGAKETGLKHFIEQKNKMYNKSQLDLQDDSFKIDGILNMDETWNMVQS